MSDSYSTQGDFTSASSPQTLSEIQNKLKGEESGVPQDGRVGQDLNEVKIEMGERKTSSRFVESLVNLKAENSQELPLVFDPELRKESLKEGDFNPDINEDAEEHDIRRKINQKLFKNKNYFMDFIGNKQDKKGPMKLVYGESCSIMVDKRSRSETPKKINATEALLKAHQKLKGRRKESPSKLMEKHQKRQKKAEELRAQIEMSRKNWFEKIRQRQMIAKERWESMVAEKKAKLQSKLEQAEERRESEIQRFKNKAKQEIQKIDETNFIMKLTVNNMKLDIDNKMNETQERRNQIIEEQKQRQQERHLKEEAVIKRKQKLQKETEIKFQSNKQKREQADKRRLIMLETKRKAAEERTKRELVLQRKLILGDKLSDVMSFLSNSENIWEFICNERDLEELGLAENDEHLFELLQKDHFEIEKMKLRRDAEILNHLLVSDEFGNIRVNKELLPYAQKKMRRVEGLFSEESSSDEELQVEEESKESVGVFFSPQRKVQEEMKRAETSVDESETFGEESKFTEQSEDTSMLHQTIVQEDDQLAQKLYQNKVKQAMRRNLLRTSRSEDLTWADFLKNEYYLRNQQSNHKRKQSLGSENTRSLHSTPERKQDIPNESDFQSHPTLTNANLHVSNSKKGNSSIKGQNAGNPNNTSSSSNISEKSRISSVVYPSKNKKNPNNSNAHKKLNSGSNQGSTHSLIGGNRDINNLTANGSTQGEKELGSSFKKVAVESFNLDSKSKKNSSRIHSSSVTDSTIANMPLSSLSQQPSLEKPQQHFDLTTHASCEMTSLITNARPLAPPMKIVQKKLTANAIKMLFPIREKKLLFKRPGKEGFFGKIKINIKIEDNFNTKTPTQNSQQQIAVSVNEGNQEGQKVNADLPSNSSRKSLQSTPTFHNRKRSFDTNNSASNLNAQGTGAGQNNQDSMNNTPQTNRLSLQHQRLQQVIMNETTALTTAKQTRKSNSNLNDSASPEKKQKLTNDSGFFNYQQNSSMNSQEEQKVTFNEQGFKEMTLKFLITDNLTLIKSEDPQKTISLEGQEADKLIDYLEQHELQFKYCRLCDLILPDHTNVEAHFQLKSHKKIRDELGIKDYEDLQYSIFSFQSNPGDISQELYREKELAIKRKAKRLKAQLNQQAISHESASYNPGKDIISANKKRFQILCMDLEKQVIPTIKDYDQLEITLKEILKILDMRKSTDLHLMRKLKIIHILTEICKKLSHCHKNEIKHLARMIEYSVKIINIFCSLKENRNYMLSTNRLISLIDLLNWCLNRPTQLFYGITFLPQLISILTLHLKHRVPYECQQIKEIYLEYLICSQITMKIKQKFQIINAPLDLSEMMGQIPLFLLQSANFLESLTTLVSMDARFRPVYEKNPKVSESVLFTIQNTDLFGIINMITTILLTRNQPFKPSGHDQTQTLTKALPKTLLSLAITCIKIINNVFRIDYRFTQSLMSDFENQEQLYHLFNYLLVYSSENSEQNEDCKELLHETLLMIGYFCLNNEKNQKLMCRGENTILQKLCNLPFPYFSDKKLKDILFPTFISVTDKSERCLAIMDQEISIELLVDYIQMNLKEELPKIIEEECDYQSMSSVGQKGVERHRSPSISSTNSSQCSVQLEMLNGNSPYLPLFMRFPKKNWKDAITFYSKVLF